MSPLRLRIPVVAPVLALVAAALSLPLARAELPTGAATLGAPQPLDAVDYIPSQLSMTGPPTVAFDGTSYSVVWTGGGVVSDPAGSVVTARVSPAGVVLDPQGVPVPNAQQPTQAVSAGGVQSLFWGGNGAPVERMQVDSSGNVLGTTSPAVGSPFRASAYGNQVVVGSFGLANDEVGASVYDATGTLVTSNASLLATNEAGLTAAAGANGVLLATGQGIGLFGYDLKPVATVPMPAASIDPIFAVAGSGDYLLLYAISGVSGPALYALRITDAGGLEDAAPIAIDPAVYDYGTILPAAATWNGTAWQLAWVTQQSVPPSLIEPYQLKTGVISSSGAFTAGATLETASQSAATVNWNLAFDLTAGPTGQTFVAWTGGSTNEILGTRLGASGAALDAQPIVISTAMREEVSPTVVRGSSGYLAAWVSIERGLLGRRFDLTGAPLDATPLVVTGPASLGAGESLDYEIAATDGEYLVTWSSDPSFAGVRVANDGTVLDATPLSLPGAVAAGGGSHFLLELPRASGDPLQVEILDSSGAEVGTPATLDPANSNDYIAGVAAAWNGSQFVVVWCVRYAADVGANTFTVNAALLALDGTLTALPALSTQSGVIAPTAVAMSGGDVLVSYDQTTLAVLDSKGAVVGAPVTVAQIPYGSHVTSDAPGRALVAWQGSSFGTPSSSAVQGLLVDFTSTPPLVGAPFALTAPTYGFGVSIASVGTNGASLLVGASTASYLPMPRGYSETVGIPLAPPGNTPDGGGVDGGGDADAGTAGDAGEDAGLDAQSGSDAGAHDAGAPSGEDGSAPSEAGAPEDASSAAANGGCGCTAAPTGGGSGAGLALFGLALALRRRRRNAG